MRRNLLAAIVLTLCWSFADAGLTAEPRLSRSRGVGASGAARAGTIQRHWRLSAPVAPAYPRYFRHLHPRFYQRQDPRSIVVITPSLDYPYEYAPHTVVTSEPFYCHMHHVGFVSRVGFLDHISGTHKVPLETANLICTQDNESCVIEAY